MLCWWAAPQCGMGSCPPRVTLRGWEWGWVGRGPEGLGQREGERWGDWAFPWRGRPAVLAVRTGLGGSPQEATGCLLLSSVPVTDCLLQPCPQGPSFDSSRPGGLRWGLELPAQGFDGRAGLWQAPGEAGAGTPEPAAGPPLRPESPRRAHGPAAASRRTSAGRTNKLHFFSEANPHVF